MNRNDQDDDISRKIWEIEKLKRATERELSPDEPEYTFQLSPPNNAPCTVPRILYEWQFNAYIVRIIESEPGIVHFEQARIEPGDPSVMKFERSDKPMGCANEIIQLYFDRQRIESEKHDLYLESAAHYDNAHMLVRSIQTGFTPPPSLVEKYKRSRLET